MLNQLLTLAKNAKQTVLALTTQQKNEILQEMAQSLLYNETEILKANEIDLQNAKGTMPNVMLDRLRLDNQRIKAMAKGICDVANLADPVGVIDEGHTCENNLRIEKTRVPMGVVAIIYESRPNVTADAAALCLKSGNVCILRGGKESINSNEAIVKALHAPLIARGLAPEIISLVTDTSRESANALMTARGYVDLLIPRGGAGLIKACVENATVPCIETGTGICHIYVDEKADLQMALNIVENAKASRPSVCNSAEVCLVNEKIANEFLPMLAKIFASKNVEMRCDETAFCILQNENGNIVKANENDFDTEFLDYIMAIAVVESVDDAIGHIAKHSTGHSEAIVTNCDAAANVFTKSVDSAAVYVNASTRFTDGGEFGLGCEIGISTQKMGARGPMGLKEMTTYKYIIKGNGQIR